MEISIAYIVYIHVYIDKTLIKWFIRKIYVYINTTTTNNYNINDIILYYIIAFSCCISPTVGISALRAAVE